MSSIIIIGILAAMGGGVYAMSRKNREDKLQLLYPSKYKAQVESSWAKAVSLLKPLGIKPHGKVRHIFEKGNARIGEHWGMKKPNGNIVGAQCESASTSSQLVRLYTSPDGYETSEEILHEHGHALLNMSAQYRTLPQGEHHAIMRRYGFPFCMILLSLLISGCQSGPYAWGY